MQLLDIFVPGLDTFVRYKVLRPADVEAFVEEHDDLEGDDYIKEVLEHVIYNLRTEIRMSLAHKDRDEAEFLVEALYNGCVMLNPGIDIDTWLQISAGGIVGMPKRVEPTNPVKGDGSYTKTTASKSAKTSEKKKKPKKKRLTKAQFRGLEPFLNERVIGQEEAVNAVVATLKRSIAGLSDKDRPLGVFLLAGASGVGKTSLAKELHSYLFGSNSEMVRIDCGEFQHKHENQKLMGSPPGYIGYDEGGQLTKKMLENPQTVVLLDEVEKAHPDLWNTFLRVFDEGVLTSGSGESVSFKDSIIVMTTNLGNDKVVESMLDNGAGFNKSIDVDVTRTKIPARASVINQTMKAVRKSFRPEFLNRIDNTIVFNHLSPKDMINIAALEMEKVESKLRRRSTSLIYGDDVLEKIVEIGVNPVEGVRGLARVRREIIEDMISDTLLSSNRWPRGSVITIYIDNDLELAISHESPTRKKAQETEQC